MSRLSHLDESGRLQMVDISDKRRTSRTAVASGRVTAAVETVRAVVADEVAKGDVLACARVAGIQAAKRAAELIPLCHPLALTWIDVKIEPRLGESEGEGSDDRPGFVITATCRAGDATGVEMEALTAVSVAALTIYDMCKAIDRRMQVDGVRLLLKSGGKSDFDAEASG